MSRIGSGQVSITHSEKGKKKQVKFILVYFT